MTIANEKKIRELLTYHSEIAKVRDPVILCAQVEEVLKSHVFFAAITHIKELAKGIGLEYMLVGNNKFRFGKDWFTFSIYEDYEASLLSLKIRSIDRSNFKKTKSISSKKFKSSGRFSQITFFYDPKLELAIEDLTELSSSILEYGYHWLKEELIALLMKERKKITSALYRHLRRLLPHDISSYAWSLSIHNGVGVSLPDSVGIREGISRAEKRNIMLKEAH